MRMTILALGSRGDVQPFVALATALQAHGHRATIAAAADYASLVTDYDIAFAPVGGYVRELMNFDLVYDILDRAHNPLRFAGNFVRELGPLMNRLVADCRYAALNSDMLIASTLGHYIGLQLVEERAQPLIAVHMHPLFPSQEASHPNFPNAPVWLPLRGAYHRLTYHLGLHGMWQLLRPLLNRARHDVLRLPPLSPVQLFRRARTSHPALYAYSALLAPPPIDLHPVPEITGDRFLERPATWQPPPEVVAFLDAGPPPVYIGFGSILSGRNPDQVTSLLVNALAESGQRGLLFRGWGDLGNIPLPDSVMVTDTIPHDWLLPQMACAVHHGGAGTTAAALRAGIPSVAVPFFGDQGLWSERVYEAGAGPPPIQRRDLSASALAAAIRQAVGCAKMRECAARLGSHLQAEEGVARAVTWLEQYLATS